MEENKVLRVSVCVLFSLIFLVILLGTAVLHNILHMFQTPKSTVFLMHSPHVRSLLTEKAD